MEIEKKNDLAPRTISRKPAVGKCVPNSYCVLYADVLLGNLEVETFPLHQVCFLHACFK